MSRKRANMPTGGPVKISVNLPDSVHLKLRLLATLRRVPATDLVASWVEREVASLRLPGVAGSGPHAGGDGPPGVDQ